jgi:hypothetical protein
MFAVSSWVFDRPAEWLLALLPFLSYPGLGWPSVLSAHCMLIVCVDALMTATLAIINWANLARHLVSFHSRHLGCRGLPTQRQGKFRASCSTRVRELHTKAILQPLSKQL